MLNKSQKLNPQKKKLSSAQDVQDEIFKNMSFEKKLLTLDEFFKFGKDLQGLNNRLVVKTN